MFSTSHIHPMVVHFPIALIMVGFLFEFVSLFLKKEPCFSKTALYLMVLGTLGAGVALTSGYLFTSALTEGEVAKIYIWHRTGAIIALIIMTIACTVRIYVAKKTSSPLKWIAFGLYFLGTLAISFTGFMGGTMVYKYILDM